MARAAAPEIVALLRDRGIGTGRSCAASPLDAKPLGAALRERGFEVETARAYGGYPLAPRRLAFFCSRR